MTISGMNVSPDSRSMVNLRQALFGGGAGHMDDRPPTTRRSRPLRPISPSPLLPVVSSDFCYLCHECSPNGLGGNDGVRMRSSAASGDASDDSPLDPFSSVLRLPSTREAGSVKPPRWESVKEKLLKVSNVASVLCVLDCTILPAVTLLLPLLGMATTPAQSAWLHELGHRVALFFVLPVGGMAASLNYFSHRRRKVSFLALLGLCLIYAANAPHGAPAVSLLPHRLAHALRCGSWVHRTTNLLGCALLLGSNYASHRLGCAVSGLKGVVAGSSDGGSCCGHDHNHGEHCL
mmetsp:Transcript_52754/g.157929  ORF Transcript_52754/g.157929 Transcript_52754/m.157929 type:complete len:291 (-) Transcript_52754:723-1595(-)|eukprot:CAMPEP_0113529996 /NCGR_PEP_ID=MMETSP0015_2-20120614/2697_1 /TAXON_ID=2838 /ORGANISM="Odontella" /LENGTH=290 /DNA_ID=CAMNT_0000428675 /DNA_START=55 /DNA_END=927 /DNA_ORIENTATION=- /assembly_acc=CAM_ASM_000160